MRGKVLHVFRLCIFTIAIERLPGIGEPADNTPPKGPPAEIVSPVFEILESGGDT